MTTPSPFKSAFLKSAEPLLYVVKRDGKPLTDPMSHNECFEWLQKAHPAYSVSHATQYEGFSIDPAQPGDAAGPEDPTLAPNFFKTDDKDFLREMGISSSLKRRPDYGLARPIDPLAKKAGFKFETPGLDRQQLTKDVAKYRELLAKTKDNKESEDLAFKLSLAEAKLKMLSQKQAAGISAAPRDYPVKRQKDGFWYIIGLQGEELSENAEGSPTIKTPDSWLNVHQNAKNLDLSEQIYRELYAEFQTNDNLKDGDTFSTPIGQFICKGVDVIPADDMAKQAIAEVDESYRCANCGCDQGMHRKGYDDNGYQVYGQCSDHPECKEYVRRGE